MKKLFQLIVITMLLLLANNSTYAIVNSGNFRITSAVDEGNNCTPQLRDENVILGIYYTYFTFTANIDASIYEGTVTGPVPNLGYTYDVFLALLRDATGKYIGASRNFAYFEESEVRFDLYYTGAGLSTGTPDGFSIPILDSDVARPWTVEIYEVEETDSQGTSPSSGYIIPPSSSPLQPAFTFDPADYILACSRLPYIGIQNRQPINEGISDNEVAVYNTTDDNGDPALHIYDINDEGDGTLALEITQDIIAPYIDNPPSENTELMTSENGKVTLYILDTGELQVNSGPDAEGKTHVLIFDGIPPTNIYGYVIDPPLFP